MNDIDALQDWFESQVGVKEEPINKVIYNDLYYDRAVYGAAYPWCCTFIWAGFKACGLSDLFFGGGKTASCTALMTWAKGAGVFVSDSYYRRGDLLLFNWKGDINIAQHIGFLTGRKGLYFRTIEGNTSDTGSQDNGGEVCVKERDASGVIGAVRPKYKEDFVTYEEFKTYMERYEKERAAQTSSSYAAPSWTRAKAAGITDGSRPRSPITREESIVMLDRLELIK